VRRLWPVAVVLAVAAYPVYWWASTITGGAMLPPAAIPPAHPQSLIVATDAGRVYGETTGTVDEFLGMPYAAPPVGALRWQPPQAVKRWSGTRMAISYGNRCAQLQDTNGPQVNTEDCLYLNVYTPATVAGGVKLPVLFMINGGRLVNGAGDQQDGSLFVQDEHIVVVSLNYRLGPFGFLDVPGLSGTGNGSHGNFGLLDQEAALRWVNQNIAGFGGDPTNVTIAGESAGAASVCALLASPPATGLFGQAIMESGDCVSQPATLGEFNGLGFAAKAGCTVRATVASCLRSKSETTLLNASSSYVPQFSSGGSELPIPVAQAISSGRFTKVPILMGTNRDEARAFAETASSWTTQQFTAFVDNTYHSLAPTVLKAYPLSAFSQPYAVAYDLAAMWTDSGLIEGIGGCPEQNLARQFTSSGVPTYFYQFDDPNAPPLSDTGPPGYQWGAAHATELPYMWPSFTNGSSLYAELTAAQLQLSGQMLAYWGAFVRDGSPAAAGQPQWTTYQSRQLMSLQPGGQSHLISGVTFGDEHDCDFWNTTGKSAEG
jgi:para-nitrobenzyl esterase